MKEQIKQQLLELSQKMLNGANFVIDQIPSTLQSYIEWNTFYYWAVSGISLVIMLLSVWVMKWAVIKEEEEDTGGFIVFSFIITGISLLVFGCSIFDAIQITWFTKSWILEQITNLL